jgi:hypothetical protein
VLAREPGGLLVAGVGLAVGLAAGFGLAGLAFFAAGGSKLEGFRRRPSASASAGNSDSGQYHRPRSKITIGNSPLQALSQISR